MTGMRYQIYRAVFTVEDKTRFLNDLRRIADDYMTHIILLDANHVAGREHVAAALRHAWRSW